METENKKGVKSKAFNSERTKLVVRAALFTALTCVMGPLSLPGEVPFSLSLIAVFLCGAFLTPGAAVASQLCYLVIGAVGIPVFSGFGSGVEKLFGPTGGYLFSYPLVALCVALAVKFFSRKNPFALAGGMIVGLLVCYTCGTLYFAYLGNITIKAALSAAVLPFIVFDLIKIAFCTTLTVLLAKRLEKSEKNMRIK